MKPSNYTTKQVAQRANVADNTVRNYIKEYPDFFSEAAHGRNGPRLFNHADLETVCTIAALRKSGMLPGDIAEHVRQQEAPPVIDVAATPAQIPLQEAANALQTRGDGALALQAGFNALQQRVEAVERTQALLLKTALWWGVLLGAIAALAVGSFILWLLYLFGG